MKSIGTRVNNPPSCVILCFPLTGFSPAFEQNGIAFGVSKIGDVNRTNHAVTWFPSSMGQYGYDISEFHCNFVPFLLTG